MPGHTVGLTAAAPRAAVEDSAGAVPTAAEASAAVAAARMQVAGLVVVEVGEEAAVSTEEAVAEGRVQAAPVVVGAAAATARIAGSRFEAGRKAEAPLLLP